MKNEFILFFLFSFFPFLLFSCAEMFQPKIPLPVNDNPGSLDDVFRQAETITQLDAPAQFYVAPYYSSSEIRLTWSAVRGAAYYMVERAVAAPGTEPDSSEYEPLERFIYGTSYVDEILKNPTLDSPEFQNRYFYRVSAFNTAQKYDESEPTIPQSAMLFRAPVGVTASGGVSEEYVRLYWEQSPGAASYEIWRSDFPNGASASLLATVRGNQYWFRNMVSETEQGKDFYYMITAKNSFGSEAPRTSPAYGYARVFGAPSRPSVRIAENSGRGHSKTTIKIEWDADTDADGVYYAVYRYSETDSSLTRLADKIEDTELTDTGLKPGIYYYYKVQAIVDDLASGKALKSELSSDDPEGFLLSSPEEVIAEKNSDNTVTIKWKPAKGNENERLSYKYNVYAGNTTEGDLSTLVEGLSPTTGTDGYISTAGLNVGNSAFFRVSTVNSSGLVSAQSIVVSPSPAAAIIQDTSQHASITGESANSNGVYPVRITWKKPADVNEVPAFYHVQRSTRAGSGFTRINEAPLRADGTGTDGYSLVDGVYTFIDRNEAARVGRKFYYRVLSLNQLEQGSFPSAEREGWGALTHTQYMIEYNKTMSAALKKLTLMYKPGSTDKLGTETKYGSIGGSIYYNAAISGLGARIIIRLDNYADFYIENVPENGVYFTLSGNSNTSANMSSNGTMDGTVTCTGMYPGRVYYDRIEIKGGAAGGGTYGIWPDGGFSRAEVPFTVVN